MEIATTGRPDLIPADQYTPDKGKLISSLYASGEPLREIVRGHYGLLPDMLQVRRWRSLYPAFDALMIEAAACRAENMAEDIIEISDDDTRQAAHNSNRMKAREKMIEALDPVKYGKANSDSGIGERGNLITLTDAQLMQIAAGKVVEREVIEGESVRVDAGLKGETARTEGGTPPHAVSDDEQYTGSGMRIPATPSGDHSVTTQQNSSSRTDIDESESTNKTSCIGSVTTYEDSNFEKGEGEKNYGAGGNIVLPSSRRSFVDLG